MALGEPYAPAFRAQAVEVAPETVAQSETSFYLRDHAALLRVREGETGQAEEIILAQGANGFRGRRVGGRVGRVGRVQ